MTKKITRGIAQIALGQAERILLGNLDAKRDWGYAPEYCEGMWRILQHDTADDFVLATGESHSVREFAEEAFANLGIEITWDGEGIREKGIVRRADYSSLSDRFDIERLPIAEGDVVIEVDPTYHRPTEVDSLLGDASKAEKVLGWRAETRFKELVRIMIDADMRIGQRFPGDL